MINNPGLQNTTENTKGTEYQQRHSPQEFNKAAILVSDINSHMVFYYFLILGDGVFSLLNSTLGSLIIYYIF